MRILKLIVKELLLLPKKMFYMFFRKGEMMTCAEAAAHLYEYLDMELPRLDYRKLKIHLEFCRKCCRKFEFEEILRSVVRNKARSEKIPSALRERILREIDIMSAEFRGAVE